MGSFVRSTAHRKVEHLSTGIAGLDIILGECLGRGTSILLLEDENSQIHSTILKVFLSEGARSQESMAAATKEGGDMEVYGTGTLMEKDNGDKMVIAWRYSTLSLSKPIFRFNLSKKKRFEGILLSGEEATLEAILDTAREKRGLRMALFSLGSPAWRFSGCGEKELMKFLFELKRLVRANDHVCMVSIPAFFMPHANFSLYFDMVAGLESNLFNRFCSNYNGILELRKIRGHGCLRTSTLESLKYGVKIKKENVCVEKIEMPPEDAKPREKPWIPDRSF
ncbi:hypothetical protein [Encephalitozoon cuniculi GB-M1]|uniref:Elongator complex protein 4 n=2 Tax=Encephalitozoon cuniculi TaxID=6035 RepID=Q8SVU4_ENCCU|nr:uncharacterized protein ECU04_0830 [Encephalitozoon cuniculi GB-M1]AGE95272.1 hypothetical protein ECU04_0830 [Encephalitozoon cuniculi]KMV66286.1 hypothetical protein M970_040760 [Encephalitozoon cuniculi EcunIII-L]CAD25270.1 hypothetical protein [Encephalitozoon cuniculi GB-M1]